MRRIIDGHKYLMRDTRPLKELRRMHQSFTARYGEMDFRRWLIERGKVYLEIRDKHK